MITVILFAVAAAFGALLAFLRFSNKPLPMLVALAHGAVAASALVALALHAFDASAGSRARLALALFVVAALGGVALFSFHLRSKQLPIPLVVIHGAVAVIAFLLLLGVGLAPG